MRIHLFLLLSLLALPLLRAQELRNPFDYPISLSANFGELRSNHFHSGLDFKTGGVVGKEVHTVREGYVARVSVSPWGYGNALYINHPEGITTVYGHLLRFSPRIADYVKQKQYELERFDIDVTLQPDELPVAADEVVALSGNTGSSGGPHLHFEIRDTPSEEPMDPMDFYLDRVDDSRPPRFHALALMPRPGKGVVNGKSRKTKLRTPTVNGQPSVSARLEAWGEIGLAIRCNDYMDGTTNIYGVKDVVLSVDSQTIFHSHLDRFSFAETRYINSLCDYAEWRDGGQIFQKCFVEPGNRLPFLETRDRGFLRIDEEREYPVAIRLTDAFGNSSTLNFKIIGKKQAIPAPDSAHATFFHWGSENRFGAKGVRLRIPKGNLYDNLYFKYEVRTDTTALADTHVLHDQAVPLHGAAVLSIYLRHDTLANKRQYGVVRFRRGRASWIGGVYRHGRVDADIRELGSYSVRSDTEAPTITPLAPQNWTRRKRITLRLSDNLSGVARYRGEIDGQYALFEMNNRSVIHYDFDEERLPRGPHELRVTVTDACGNEAVYTHHFTW